jgi:periplasmic protein TonB
MFDLVRGRIERPFRDRKPGMRVASIVGHVLLLTLILGIPLLYTTQQLPKVGQIAAFIVTASAPAPPPPPPPPAPKARPAQPQARPADTVSATAAPVEAPSAVLPEKPVPVSDATAGMVGGVEGGVVGGVVGGIVGGLVGAPPPPPPAPRPAAPPAPVRVGGQIQTPELVARVDPKYPPVAVAAKLTGTVILEVTVNEGGRVTSVNVLRSLGLLDQAAVEAVKQWQYSPLMLNGIPTPFIVTVTVNFSLRQPVTPTQNVG